MGICQSPLHKILELKGDIVCGILLLTLSGTPNIEVLKKNLIDLLVAITVYWAVGLGLVWAVYRLGKFILRYGPFV